jgi:hypothetical protein
MKKFKLIKSSLSFSRSSVLIWIPRSVLLVSMLAFGYAGWFFYQNILRSINEAIILESISQDFVTVDLDVIEYETVNDSFLEKIQVMNPTDEVSRNPFKQPKTQVEALTQPDETVLDESVLIELSP